MTFRMVSLGRAANGDWLARKGIPADIKEAYKAAYGISAKERFRRPGSLSADRAKQELRDWEATISERISTLQGVAKGEGRSLTQRQAYRLAGNWYVWFVDRFENDPGEPWKWDTEYNSYQDALPIPPDWANNPDACARWENSEPVRTCVL